jgi:hypothetical protein
MYSLNSNRNYANDTLATHTLNEGIYPASTLVFNQCSCFCSSVNITNNTCYFYTAFKYYSFTSSGISYSSIVNNTADGGYCCISFDNIYAKYSVHTCNILSNHQTDDSQYGIIYSFATVLIVNSCILGNNKGNMVFYARIGTSSAGNITLSNCTLDNFSFYGSVTINETIKVASINALSHIATQKCDSYFDSNWAYGLFQYTYIEPSTETQTEILT